ncbi:MAG: pyridoxal-phosphate dependent enzyme [Candidatus Limnocylindrales bacterium]
MPEPDDFHVPPLDDGGRFPLIDGPSPLHQLPRFTAALKEQGAAPDLDVWIKREDLLGLAFGGNKLRNLEYLVGEALAAGADTLVTAGRRWSNHCRLTAAAAVRANLACHIVLTGPPLPRPGPNHRLIELLGATVHVTATDERADRERTVDRLMTELRAQGRRPHAIGVGGSSEVGAIGQFRAGQELIGQLRANGLMSTSPTICVPSATGGTQAGLMVALDTPVIGFAVAHPADELRASVRILAEALARRFEIGPPGEPILVDASAPAYGRRSRAADEAAALLASTEAILADPVYTAKALAGLITMARSRDLRGPVVFWHGGGAPGLFEPLDQDPSR